MNRRNFIRKTSTVGALALSGLPLGLARPADDYIKLTILHTNDWHSRIEPFSDGYNKGKGGAENRAIQVSDIRAKEENTILLDSGDIFQGTPYFNMFGGEIEMKLMSELGYEASTMGNHDFDGGIDGFKKQLVHCDFPFITTNYDLSDTILHDQTKDYLLLNKNGIKIGLIGLGIELNGLVPVELYQNTRYLDPIKKGDEMAYKLKKEHGADLVICLSHLGYQYFSNKIDDMKLAQSTEHIDVILGGHTHTFLPYPTILKNAKGKPVIINQAGWASLALGKINLFFSKNKLKADIESSNLIIS